MEQQLPMRDRISTIVKKQDYTNDEEAGDAWVFPIGWNRKVDTATGHSIDEPRDPRFLTNKIQSAKYTCLNFIPLNFFHQIKKGPNIYYFIICVLQMFDAISITNGSPTNLPPLLFLMTVSMIKDYFEDRRRRKSDNSENQSEAILIGPQDAENESKSELNVSEIPWHAVKTGQLVKVKKNQFFPADIILLASSAPKNMCYVETKGLDGETNLKHKIAPKELQCYENENEMTRYFDG